MSIQDPNMARAKNSVYAFFDDINRFGYNADFTDISYSRAKKNYENILKRLYELDLPNPGDFSFDKMSIEELISTLETLLVKILGDTHLPYIKHLESLIKKDPSLTYFDAVIEESIETMPPKVENIYISSKRYNIQVASTGHEMIHAFLSKYKGPLFNSHFTNVHYNELLSILVEYILVYKLSELLKDPKLISTHEVIRISHDHDQATELLDMRKLSFDINRSNHPEAPFYRKYSEYQEHNALTYIIDDIYSIHLLEHFKNDPEVLTKLIRAVLEGEKTLLDILKYYDISLRNRETLELYNSQINRTLSYKR